MDIIRSLAATLTLSSLMVVLASPGWSATASAGTGSAGGKKTSDVLGDPGFMPTPERPVGWRGDWTGRFLGATPPIEWSRRAQGITAHLRYQADKPSGEPAKDCQPLEYFSIKDWLVAGPFAADDPVKDMDKDFLGGEAAVQPAKDAKVGSVAWKYLRADVETQSRHDCNGGTCGNSNVDFVYAFGTISGEAPMVKIAGDFTNKIAYAHTYIYAPAEGTVQMQMPFDGVAGRFWLNGKALNLEPGNRSKIFDVALAKGWNRLLIKIGTDNGLRGKNGDGEWASRWLVAAYLMPVAPVSYETKNVAWMTKMTGRSMSQPIIVGDRIFIGSGISDLLCLDKKTGKVLWLRSNTPYDALTVADRAAIPGMQEKLEPLVAKLRSLDDELVAAINAAVSPQGMSSPQQETLDQKVKAKNAAERAVHDACAAIDKKRFPQMFLNEVASSNAAPVSDGRNVYWICGGAQWGACAFFIGCFDLDGKRVWGRIDSSLTTAEHGVHATPVLADGKLMYPTPNLHVAYDAKTGVEVWRVPKPTDGMNWFLYPVIAKIGGINVIINHKSLYRVSDGTEIGRNGTEALYSHATPIVQDGVIYDFGRHRSDNVLVGFTAAKLPASVGPGAKGEVLWDPEGKDVALPLRGHGFMISSPLYAEGLVYSLDMSGGLSVLDPVAKKCAYRLWLDGYNRYSRAVFGVVASPTLGGKNIYITDDAGFTHVILPGPQFKEIGRNVLENIHRSGEGSRNPCLQESFYTSPYFDGKAMYLRGEEYLYCIGAP